MYCAVLLTAAHCAELVRTEAPAHLAPSPDPSQRVPVLPRSFPGLEKVAEQRRWQLPWVAVTLYDPLLQVGPLCLSKGFWNGLCLLRLTL